MRGSEIHTVLRALPFWALGAQAVSPSAGPHHRTAQTQLTRSPDAWPYHVWLGRLLGDAPQPRGPHGRQVGRAGRFCWLKMTSSSLTKLARTLEWAAQPSSGPSALSIRELAALAFLRAVRSTESVGDREVELLQKRFAWSWTTARKVLDRLLERELIAPSPASGDAA